MNTFLDQYLLWQYSGTGAGSIPVFDLQLFAAEDEGRTEQPTDKKLREARDKGQVARTQELPQAMVVIVGILVVFAFGSMIYESLFKITRYYFSSFSRMSLTQKSIGNDFFLVLGEFARILLPIFLATSIAAFFANVVQIGFKFTPHQYQETDHDADCHEQIKKDYRQGDNQHCDNSDCPDTHENISSPHPAEISG